MTLLTCPLWRRNRRRTPDADSTRYGVEGVSADEYGCQRCSRSKAIRSVSCSLLVMVCGGSVATTSSRCWRALPSSSVQDGLAGQAYPQLVEELVVMVRARVGRGEELLTEEDAVCPGVQAQGLQLVAHRLPAGRQAHHRMRHQQAGRRDRADQLESVDRLDIVQWRARHLHEQVDRHALRMGVPRRQLVHEAGPVVAALAHPHDPAAA